MLLFLFLSLLSAHAGPKKNPLTPSRCERLCDQTFESLRLNDLIAVDFVFNGRKTSAAGIILDLSHDSIVFGRTHVYRDEITAIRLARVNAETEVVYGVGNSRDLAKGKYLGFSFTANSIKIGSRDVVISEIIDITGVKVKTFELQE